MSVLNRKKKVARSKKGSEMTPASKSEAALPIDADVERATEGNAVEQGSQLQRMIGPLNVSQRYDKILKFILRKRTKGSGKKFTYECRKQVAEKRLRIKGRFVTKQQAFDILGLKEDDLKTNETL